MVYRSGKRLDLRKRLVVGGIVLLLIAAITITGLQLAGVMHLFRTKSVSVASGSSFSSKGEPKATTPTGQNSNSTVGSSDSGGKPSGSSLALVTPFGDFVSNHHPNLSGSPAPNSLSSVCNSTPGASCQITFSKDGVSKSLPAQTADSNGSVFWDWKLQDIGLTAGSWKIQAIASLNGRTKIASDTMDLVIAQ